MLRALIIIAALVVIFAGIKAAATLVVPFLLAVFLAVLVTPPFLRMKNAGIPVPIALGLMVLALGVMGVLAVTILRTSLDQFTANLPEYEESLKTQLRGLGEWLVGLGVEAPDELLAETFNPQFAMRYAGLIARSLSGILGLTFIIFVITAFMIVEAGSLDRKLRAMAGRDSEGLVALEKNLHDMRRYVSLKSVMSLLTGALVTVWLWFLGVDNALFMGLLAFFLNFVPNVGSIFASVPGILLGLVQLGPGMAVVTAIGYLCINVGISNVLEPRFMGRNLGLSPLVVLLSLVFWGWLLGPVGMLLCVPLTMAIKVLLENIDATRPIAILIGRSPGS